MAKNMVRLCVLIIVAALFATCALVEAPVGSISFAFPAGVLSRGIGNETYRVAFYYGLVRYQAAPDIAGDTLTFSDLPTGDVRIIVARGRPDDDGFFYTDASGQIFTTIVPGDNGPIDLDLSPSKFIRVDSLQGENVTGLAQLEGTFYAATTGTLLQGTFASGTFNVSGGPDVPDGVAVSSITIGKVYDLGALEEQVWVNGSWSETTGGGIMPWTPGSPGTLDLNFASGFGNPDNRQDGVLADLTIEYAGAFEVPVEGEVTEEGLALMFQRNGGMGGIYLTSSEFETDPAEWPWIVDEINFDELLADIVQEGSEFVRDLIVSERTSAAYIVTSIATMKVSKGIISGESAFDSVDDILDSDAVAYAPDLGSDIVSIDVEGEEAEEMIYLGTKNGLYMGKPSTTAAEFFDGGGTGTLVGGTAGYYIKMISAQGNGDLIALVARRGSSPDFLIIVNREKNKTLDFRRPQGIPGNRLSNLVWLNENVLAVSGDHGLSVIDTSSLF